MSRTELSAHHSGATGAAQSPRGPLSPSDDSAAAGKGSRRGRLALVLWLALVAAALTAAPAAGIAFASASVGSSHTISVSAPHIVAMASPTPSGGNVTGGPGNC